MAARADGRTGLMPAPSEPQRLRVCVHGVVQGVGFRPHVYRLARDMRLTGWVANDTAGVVIEVQGREFDIARFMGALAEEAPPRAQLHTVRVEYIAPGVDTDFTILKSHAAGARSAVVLPDLATCADCLADVRAAGGRREGYAFTNCTNCGPRFSIIRELPYDRPATTMARFTMCPACAAEYDDPGDRRFHAQPNACAACGPRLALLDRHGETVTGSDPLAAAAAALHAGQVVAVKGIGGFHLMVDARNADAIALLRARKRRPTRPLAVMAASVADARRFVDVCAEATRLLESAECPIVLLPRRAARMTDLFDGALTLPDGLAPDNPRLGVMLPPSPLHHLLLQCVGAPVVATSGNLSEEPICIDEQDALVRLAGIADLFLVHDRPIERHVDDSVADIVDGAPRLLRRARGYAPLPVRLPAPLPTVLATGAHMKNAVALSRGSDVFISQHIGDLDAAEAQHAFARVATDLLRLYEAEPAVVAHDMHPDYAATVWAREFARRRAVPATAVQHHHAHLVACMAENGVQDQTLGVIWDGTGYGTDGTIWGGEFLLGDATACARVAHLLPFRLPGGAAAVREPRRVAAALLHAACGVTAVRDGAHRALASFSTADRRTLVHMLETGLHAPVTSSAGRLFDGIAALFGLCTVASFEGEAAIRLEHAADPAERGAYAIELTDTGASFVLDWRPMVRAAVQDARRGTAIAAIAARVHNALADAIALQAELACCDRVALSGGCFQNRLLSERATSALRQRGFRVLTHRRVPPNDGGIALGQAVIAATRLAAARAAADAADAAPAADAVSTQLV